VNANRAPASLTLLFTTMPLRAGNNTDNINALPKERHKILQCCYFYQKERDVRGGKKYRQPRHTAATTSICSQKSRYENIRSTTEVGILLKGRFGGSKEHSLRLFRLLVGVAHTLLPFRRLFIAPEYKNNNKYPPLFPRIFIFPPFLLRATNDAGHTMTLTPSLSFSFLWCSSFLAGCVLYAAGSTAIDDSRCSRQFCRSRRKSNPCPLSSTVAQQGTTR